MAKISKPRTVKGFATLCAKAAADKKAENIMILDLTEVESAPADYFVICTADSEPQLRAITKELTRWTSDVGSDNPKMEGVETGEWSLLDFFDVVVHVMLKPIREFYQLEKLWGDAKFYLLEPEADKPRKMRQNEVRDYIIGGHVGDLTDGTELPVYDDEDDEDMNGDQI